MNFKFQWLALFSFSLAWSWQVQAQSLAEAQEIALSQAPSLKAKQAQTQSEYAYIKMAKAANYPLVTAQAGYTLLDNAPASKMTTLAGTQEIENGDQNFASASVMAQVPLYTSGRLSGAVKAAEYNYQAKQFAEAIEQQKIKFQVTQAYIQVLKAHESLKLAQENRKLIAQNLADTRVLVKQQMANTNDLLRIQLKFSEAEQKVFAAEQGLKIAHAAFNRQLGQPLDTPVHIDPLIYTDQGLSDLEQLQTLALRQRSELKMLNAQYQALLAKKQQVEAEGKPQVFLQAGYDYQENSHMVHEGKWIASLQAKWELFDAGSSRYQGESFAQQAQALKAQLEDTKQNIQLQVRQAYLTLAQRKQALRSLQTGLKQAEENLSVVLTSYQAGLVKSSDLLAAKTLKLQAQTALNIGQYDLILAQEKLIYALGQM